MTTRFARCFLEVSAPLRHPVIPVRHGCLRPIDAALRVCVALLAGVSLVAIAACDPCSGIIGCADGRYLAASGQIVDSLTGKGIDGVRVDVVRTGGIAVDHDSLSDLSHDGGFWRVEFSPASEGTVVADVRVTPPNAPSYRLHDLQLESRPNRGDANLNERWVTSLYFIDVGEFFIEGTQDQRLVGATVSFRRTGGAVLSGPGIRDGVYQTVSDAIGRVYFFQGSGNEAVTVEENIDVIGDLTIQPAGSPSATTFSGIHIAPKHELRDNRNYPPVIRLPVPVGSTP